MPISETRQRRSGKKLRFPYVAEVLVWEDPPIIFRGKKFTPVRQRAFSSQEQCSLRDVPVEMQAFNHIRQVAPAAQERATYVWTRSIVSGCMCVMKIR